MGSHDCYDCWTSTYKHTDTGLRPLNGFDDIGTRSRRGIKTRPDSVVRCQSRSMQGDIVELELADSG
jgi:hypothetical protein